MNCRMAKRGMSERATTCAVSCDRDGRRGPWLWQRLRRCGGDAIARSNDGVKLSWKPAVSRSMARSF